MAESIVAKKSKSFAVEIVKMYKYLCDEKKELVMSKQLLRSGTSIGANLHESIYAQSTNDFISKNSIALKEVAETEYWLQLLYNTGYLDQEQYEGIRENCSELAKMLISIVKTAKKNREQGTDNR